LFSWQFLLSQCPVGEELLKDFKSQGMEMISSSPETPIKNTLSHELSSTNARFNNVQAALRTWLDHVNRLIQSTEDFDSRATEINARITSCTERLAEIETPRNFTELKSSISKLKVSNYLKFLKNFQKIPKFSKNVSFRPLFRIFNRKHPK